MFHPLCISKKDIFLQEGWHYELEEPESELVCNGVVYNEMKGAYASCDTLIDSQMNRLLFPDNCYRFQSGGDPEHITELTYENYVESYKKFYHPSNSYIILDGDIEIESVLAKLEKILKEYDRQETDADLLMQKPTEPKKADCCYEVGERENSENKMILAEGWVYGRFDEPEKGLACAALAEVLCGSNDSPLKKALIENELAEDAEISVIDGILQPCLRLVVRHTSEKKKEKVWSTVQETLKKLAENGLHHRDLEAALDRMEFRMRDREYGGFPEGVVNAMRALESWLYGGDPAQNLCCQKSFQSLRGRLKEGYFEKLVREVFLENPHRARVELYPSKTLGMQKREREVCRLENIKDSWSQEERERMAADFRMFRERQGMPDSPGKLGRLPRLSLSDIPEMQEIIPQTVAELEGNTVLRHELETNGIIHFSYYFSLEGFTPEELCAVSFLRVLLGQTETENYSAFDIQAELKSKLGRFETAAEVSAGWGQTEECRPYLVINVSVLKEKLEEAVRLICEVLNRSRFCDVSSLRSRVR